jgi:DNA-binding response OmpR family regulator
MVMPENSSRVLIVEDDRDFAESLVIALGTRKCQVDIAGSGEEAVRKFRHNRYDIAFMDVKLPGMNGVQSLAEILMVAPDARVVMMTGFSEQSLLDQALRTGAVAVLLKPFRMRELLAYIDQLQDRPGPTPPGAPATH